MHPDIGALRQHELHQSPSRLHRPRAVRTRAGGQRAVAISRALLLRRRYKQSQRNARVGFSCRLASSACSCTMPAGSLCALLPSRTTMIISQLFFRWPLGHASRDRPATLQIDSRRSSTRAPPTRACRRSVTIARANPVWRGMEQISR